jgi:hypothetical protein
LLTSVTAISMTDRPTSIPRKFNQSEATMETAGGPGDRGSGHRKMVGREESPDTVLSHQGTIHPLNRGCKVRATRLVTPGERFGWHRLRPVAADSITESATENIPPAERHGGIAQENLRDVFAQLVTLVRVKRWGKSPPLVWQHTRHGKPRVVQGQIGGESRPGSSSQRSRGSRFRAIAARMRSLGNGASCCREQPSGRPLESRREP